VGGIGGRGMILSMRAAIGRGERCGDRISGRGSYSRYVDLEQRIRLDHPAARDTGADGRRLLPELPVCRRDFAALYSGMGRPSIAPEMLPAGDAVAGVSTRFRSERQLMERLEFDLLFRWFVGLGIDDAVWDHSTFSKNRDRLLEGEIAARFLSARASPAAGQASTVERRTSRWMAR